MLIDIGYKSEGIVPIDEWYHDTGERPEPGLKVSVLLEEIEDEFGLILLSKKKADRIREWLTFIAAHKEGDIVKGDVIRKIKGGLLVNIGVNVFLRRVRSISAVRRTSRICRQAVGMHDSQNRRAAAKCRRLTSPVDRRQRQKLKEKLLGEIEVGQIRKGIVKNIADFGAFVDLGGIDGLLHITDMSWGRNQYPRNGQDRRRNRGQDSARRPRQGKDRPRSQAEGKESWDEVESKYPSAASSRARSSMSCRTAPL